MAFETDEPIGVNNGVGFNRIEAGLSGPLARRLTFAIDGTLEGQRSVEEGLDSQGTPIFLQAGVDTTINQSASSRTTRTRRSTRRPLADTTAVPDLQLCGQPRRLRRVRRTPAADGTRVQTPSRSGHAEQLSGLIATACACRRRRERRYSATGKLNYTYGAGSRVSLSLCHQPLPGPHLPLHYRLHQQSLTGHARGFSNRNRLATLNWTQNLSKSVERSLALDVALSYQQDRTINGPLTIESDLSTRDPFGGLIIGGMDFEYDFDNFPVDDELIDNIRRNRGPDHADRREQRQQLLHDGPGAQQRVRSVRQLPELRQHARPAELGHGRDRGGSPTTRGRRPG